MIIYRWALEWIEEFLYRHLSMVIEGHGICFLFMTFYPRSHIFILQLFHKQTYFQRCRWFPYKCWSCEVCIANHNDSFFFQTNSVCMMQTKYAWIMKRFFTMGWQQFHLYSKHFFFLSFPWNTWKVAGFLIALLPLLPPFQHWIIYSTNGMCLGLPLSVQEAPGRLYSVAVFVGFNFLLFLLIAAGQMAVYR